MEGLGRLYQIGTSVTTANTRFRMQEASGVAFVLIGATSGNATFQTHTAASGGTSTNFASITRYYTQASGVWTKVTQAAAATITAVTGGLAVVEIDAASMPDGHKYVSGSHSAGSFVVLLRDLTVQRAPANFANING